MKPNIKKWMRENAADHDDGCGGIEMTTLAEAAALVLNLYGPAPKYEIPEEVFEIAYEVSSWYERNRN